MIDCSTKEKVKCKLVTVYSRELEGDTYLITDKVSHSIISTYIDDSDKSTLCLCYLTVPEIRKQKGIGTILFNAALSMAIKLKVNRCSLLVRKDSWMRDWYLKFGFTDDVDNESDSRFIYMIKEL